MSQKNLIVAFGGMSPEHEVSVLTALQAVAALEESHYTLIPLYITKSGNWLTGKSLLKLESFKDLKKVASESIPCTFSHNDLGQPVLLELRQGWFSKEVAHPIHALLTAFHGSDGENGSFQGICELYHIPYTGSGVLASALGMDKLRAKEFCKNHDLPVVDGIGFHESEWVDSRDSLIAKAESIRYPLIVKPVHLGSSIGVEMVEHREDLIRSVETAFRYDARLLIEKAVKPLTEVNCSVLGSSDKNRASVCERPIGKEELLSFTDKYMRDEAGSKGMASADRVIPADIDDDLTRAIQETSRTIFSLLGCSGLARLDFLVNSNTGDYYFNEINTIPGSFSFYLWKESGIEYPQLLEELIKLALDRHSQKNGRIQSYETNLLSEKAVKGIKGLKTSK
ncbi:D-alanine--D-alanine ligase family protein [Rhodohalobacter mucosus]|uniref:D-alanine--D-alanine ligase n=1 Tax=Rhodohalobacter mucosus TaxID=2079485 RepID=A0A316TP81_9BACT|nr:D-alanine--D-alanine ligase family protein [Rhodohalobacter mucosus]PWN05608.1 D-alanine--D-alanine ligase [Rhodohalobacter mucosus]